MNIVNFNKFLLYNFYYFKYSLTKNNNFKIHKWVTVNNHDQLPIQLDKRRDNSTLMRYHKNSPQN